jgi:hypothetical protein
MDVLVIILVLPFCQPIPLPGFSTPFGIALMIFGFRIALRQRPWLPGGSSGARSPTTRW